MGYLLKEALKTLCGVNQWAYAVFWKIGCQNPKLLIWEDCYYESPWHSGNTNLENAFSDYNIAENCNLKSGVEEQEKTHLLVSQMMMENHVKVVGEGLVGRAAFTQNHQWILSENLYRESHPPEVLKELCRQFSADMQTVAVIPVLHHGVVQFGSFSTIMENVGFVNNVTTLVVQLGHLSGVVPPDDFSAKEPDSKIEVPGYRYLGNSTPGNSTFTSSAINPPSSCLYNNFDLIGNLEQTSMSHDPTSFGLDYCWPQVKSDFSGSNHLMNAVAKAEVILSNPKTSMNQNASVYIPRSTLDVPPSCPFTTCSEQKVFSDTSNQGRFITPDMSAAQTNSSLISGTAPVESLGPFKGAPNYMKQMSGMDSFEDVKWVADELKNTSSTKMQVMGQNPIEALDISVSQNLSDSQFLPSEYDDDSYARPVSGEDLFDVIGADFKNQLFSSCSNSRFSHESALAMHSLDRHNLALKKRSACSEIYSTSLGNTESGIFSSAGTGNLLEAVVSKVPPSAQRSIEESVSCRTTLTSMSTSSAANAPLPYGLFGASDHVKGELFGVPKYLTRSEATSSSSLRIKQSGAYSQGSSIYGSEISSWIEKDQKAKQSNSVSTGYSKKPEDVGKTNRRRLKPGENPRPRPKDRQMIQDRVKELREIVPNGAKCSIDALLERTIKHMLFLQSVTKHADKLKQTGESKIISKDGGLLLRDNFEGGATWAYEIGSQSMVCPIIVEDLNQPRQMLVEMLCDEKGLFLEIADIIRGLGLTILKGVMESRNDKIWARFAVEANRDITRMEIFLSLVRLLDQSGQNSVAQQKGIGCSGNPMAASVPHSFQ